MNNLKEKIIEFLKKNPKPTDEKFHKFIEGMGLDPDEGEAAAYSILGEILTAGKSKGKTDKVNPKELAMGIKVEAEHTGNKEIAKKIARDHLAEFSNYYSKLLAMEKDMKKTKKFIKIFDNLFIKMEKAKIIKYIKRIKNPSGKGYIYFYTKEQLKNYKESPHKPGRKTKDVTNKGGLLSGIMSFFGISDKKQAQEKVDNIYNSNKDKLSGVDKPTFSNYLNEYLSNKEKWDKRLQEKPKVIGKKKDGQKIAKKSSDKTVVMSPKEKRWDLSVMKKVVGVVGGVNGQTGDEQGTEVDGVWNKIENPSVVNITDPRTGEFKLADKKDILGTYDIGGEKAVLIKKDKGKFVVIEYKTGINLSSTSPTKKEALESAKNAVKRHGIDKIKEIVKDSKHVNKEENISDKKDNFSTMPEGEGKEKYDSRKDFRESLPEEPDESKVKLVRVATANEKKSWKHFRTKGFKSISDKKGFEVTYKPYGEQGAGYYYVPLSKKTPLTIIDSQYDYFYSKKSEKPSDESQIMSDKGEKQKTKEDIEKKEKKTEVLSGYKEFQEKIKGSKEAEARVRSVLRGGFLLKDGTFAYYKGLTPMVTNDFKELKVHESDKPLKKASILKLNGKYYKLNKAKVVPVGTISKDGKTKKVAQGKWVPVGTGDKPKKPDEKPKKDGKPDDDKKKKDPTSEENTVREKMKVALKKIATILADALSGKEVVQPTGSGIEEVGERIKQKKKPLEKKEEPKGKK